MAMAVAAVVTVHRMTGPAAGDGGCGGLAGAPGQVTGARTAMLCPRLSAACQVAMGITMSYMLVQML